MKFEGIGGWIRKYRFRFNLIVLIYSKELVQHNIKVSETFTVISNFLSCLNSIFGRNSQNGQWEKIFFSVQSSETGNLLKNKSCENVWKGYNDFASRTFDYVKGSKKLIKGQCTAAVHSDGVGVNSLVSLEVTDSRFEPLTSLEAIVEPGPFLTSRFARGNWLTRHSF